MNETDNYPIIKTIVPDAHDWEIDWSTVTHVWKDGLPFEEPELVMPLAANPDHQILATGQDNYFIVRLQDENTFLSFVSVEQVLLKINGQQTTERPMVQRTDDEEEEVLEHPELRTRLVEEIKERLYDAFEEQTSGVIGDYSEEALRRLNEFIEEMKAEHKIDQPTLELYGPLTSDQLKRIYVLPYDEFDHGDENEDEDVGVNNAPKENVELAQSTPELVRIKSNARIAWMRRIIDQVQTPSFHLREPNTNKIKRLIDILIRVCPDPEQYRTLYDWIWSALSNGDLSGGMQGEFSKYEKFALAIKREFRLGENELKVKVNLEELQAAYNLNEAKDDPFVVVSAAKIRSNAASLKK